jgi:oxygen-dependent protoporphyrinogen oxidase
MTREVDVAIVGGGIAGLTAAYGLLRRCPELRIVLIEGRPRLGGNVRTVVRDGCVLDLGPDVVSSFPAAGFELCALLGIDRDLVAPAAGRVQVATGDRIAPLPEGVAFGVPRDLSAIATTSLLSVSAKLRAACDLILPDGPREIALGPLVERRLGREVKDRLVAPLVAGVYGGDVDRLDARVVMPQLAAARGSLIRALARAPRGKGPPVQAPLAGMRAIVDALASAIGPARIARGVSVKSIAAKASGYLVETSCGDLAARKVVVATPPAVAGRLVQSISPALAHQVEGIQMRSVASVIVAFDAAETELPSGNGLLAARGEPSCFAAASFLHAKWPDRIRAGLCVVRAVVGDDRVPELSRLDDDAVVARVVHDLRRHALVPNPAWSLVERFVASTAIPVVGHADRVAEVRRRVSEIEGLAIVGGGVDGPGLAGCMRGATAAAEALAA